MIAEGTPPARFAIEHAHYDVDVPFWRELAAEVGGPILDVGAAVGRITLPLARDGHEVCALDGSREMLTELTRSLEAESDNCRRRVSVVQSDFRAIDLPPPAFALAIMPMNSLQALLTDDDLGACLAGIRRHLAPGGVFAFDVVAADLDALGSVIGVRQPGPSWTVVTGAHLSQVAWFTEVDRATGVLSFTTQILEDVGDGVIVEHLRPHTVRVYSASYLWTVLHDAGFEVQAVFGDFSGGPLTEDTERQIYRCGVAT